jgi:hypothetical protein
LEKELAVTYTKPKNQTAYYQAHPPKCIADFLVQPTRLDNIELDGHGSSGIYPDRLAENPNTVFAIRCQCGSSVHRIVAESEHLVIWRHENLVIAERYFLECGSCHVRHQCFDRFSHGYDAEASLVEGFSLKEFIEIKQSLRRNEKAMCECVNCKGTTFEVFMRFEYPSDLFDEPLFEGREQEFFSWFTSIGKCSTCSTIHVFIDYECA